ncbi:MAG TPA: septum site-determining protein MinC [Firmicutes bacterium]|nr:septum site-determining protein MinC [Bacillales bacterium]HJA40141.1 septum site-determining protein MinC [Bacillota bacterium]
MEQTDSQFMVIKGTKDGLMIYLDDLCSYQELFDFLNKNKNEKGIETQSLVSVTVHTGNRYLNEVQCEEIKAVLRKNYHFYVEAFDSYVISLLEAEQMLSEAAIEKMSGVVRSGQSVYAPGDFLLIGDVNPGGEIEAGGNIYILGSLRGIAKAGIHGNPNAIVVAANFIPLQVHIAGVMARSKETADANSLSSLTFAYLNEDKQIEILGLREFLSDRRRRLGK